MRTLLPVVLFILLIVAYFALALGVGFDQRIPWLALLVGAAISVWATLRWRAERTTPRLIVASMTAVLLGLFAWYTIDYSSYDSRALAIADGQVVEGLDGLVLSDHRGEPRAVLASDAARATLVVLYRGYW